MDAAAGGAQVAWGGSSAGGALSCRKGARPGSRLPPAQVDQPPPPRHPPRLHGQRVRTRALGHRTPPPSAPRAWRGRAGAAFCAVPGSCKRGCTGRDARRAGLWLPSRSRKILGSFQAGQGPEQRGCARTSAPSARGPPGGAGQGNFLGSPPPPQPTKSFILPSCFPERTVVPQPPTLALNTPH